jgi:hypothetical protein
MLEQALFCSLHTKKKVTFLLWLRTVDELGDGSLITVVGYNTWELVSSSLENCYEESYDSVY